ncbi:MAG: tetratricopeptide repeat protein [bacterium]|nr:tetratricopeptide repeat protein [bacterium]
MSFALSLPGAVMAGPVEDAMSQARQDVEQGRCEQAAARLRGISGLESRAALLAGQCQIRTGLYPEALSSLDRIRGADDLSREQVGDVELYRGVALYHLERYTEAAAALDSARGLTSEEAQLQLYTGLLFLRDGDNDRAAPALEAASRLEPRLTEPVASYYAGLAWQGSSERERARNAFQRVVDLDGDGPWGKEAAKLLESTELFPYYVRGRVGVEYDDNVLLRGSVTETGAAILDIAGEKDWRGVWDIDGGVRLWQAEDGQTDAGLTAGYSGNAHVDLDGLDTHFIRTGAYLSRRLGARTVAQARYQFGYAHVKNENDYLFEHLGQLSLTHTWQKNGTTFVFADVVSDDLRFRNREVTNSAGGGAGNACGVALAPGEIGCSPAGVEERNARDRDGIGYGAAVEHRYLVPLPNGLDDLFEELEIGGGYRFGYYDSEGDEWQHFANTLSAILEVELPLDFSVLTRGSYTRRDFDNPSTFPDAETAGLEYALSNDDREENEWIFSGEVVKGITDNFSASVAYQYLDNDSNRDAYNYDRHIVGGYLNFRFD